MIVCCGAEVFFLLTFVIRAAVNNIYVGAGMVNFQLKFFVNLTPNLRPSACGRISRLLTCKYITPAKVIRVNQSRGEFRPSKSAEPPFAQVCKRHG